MLWWKVLHCLQSLLGDLWLSTNAASLRKFCLRKMNARSTVQIILDIFSYYTILLRNIYWRKVRSGFHAAKIVIISFLILYYVMLMLQSRGLDSLCMTIALTYCLISSWIKTRQVIREKPHRTRLTIVFELLFFCCTRHYHSISHKA